MRFISVVIFVISFIISILIVFINLEKETIKIGLLYSKTGTMSVEEDVIAKMVRYKIDDINKNGGLLNNKIEIVEYDGKSDPKEFKKGMEFLTSQGINTIFGCWTSASRKAVKSIVEKNNALLFYPVQYEGSEKSPNIIYLGALPNQQINPVVNYIKEHYGKKIYIVGSDYIYPRMSEIYLKILTKYIDMDIIGSKFIQLGNKDLKEIISDIKEKSPNSIINMLNGTSNKAFFEELKANGIDSSKIPVFSLSIDESSINYIGSNLLNGHYAVNGYFNNIQSPENKSFQKELQKMFGKEFTLTDAAYNIFTGVKLWERAVKYTNKTDTKELLNHIKGDSINSISGIIYVDPMNNHLHKNIRIGKVKDSGFNTVWKSDTLTRPNPFPILRTKEFWLKEEDKLYNFWNKSWQYNGNKGDEK